MQIESTMTYHLPPVRLDIIKKTGNEASTVAQWVKNLTAVSQSQDNAEMWICSPAQHSGLKGSGVATAAAWIQSLAQELLCAAGAAIEKETTTFFQSSCCGSMGLAVSL